jgi:hypothetical protein
MTGWVLVVRSRSSFDQALEVEAQGVGRFLHRLIDDRVTGVAVQHAHCLGALSGEQECEFAHRCFP